MEVRVHDLDVFAAGEKVLGFHFLAAFCLECDNGGFEFAVKLEVHHFQVEDNLSYILLHAFDGGELMLHVFHFYGHDGRPIESGKQYTAHWIADCGAVASLERLDYEFTVVLIG